MGAVGGTILVVALDDTFPAIWLPLLMGVALAAVVSAQPWLTSSRLATLFCASMTLGTSFTYALSTKPVTSRFGSAVPKFELVGLGVVFLFVSLLFLGRGLFQKKTSKMAAWLIIPIAASCIVGYVSGGIGGSDHMVRLFIRLFHLSQSQAEVIVHYVRKGIHLSAYGILGFSLLRSATAGSASKGKAFAFAMLGTLCVASFDELRQTAAPNRTGSAWDVALDLSGALVFVAIGLAMTKRGTSSTPAKLK